MYHLRVSSWLLYLNIPFNYFIFEIFSMTSETNKSTKREETKTIHLSIFFSVCSTANEGECIWIPQGTRHESNLCSSTLLSSLSLWLKVLLGLCSLTYTMHCFMHSLMSSYNVPVSPQQFSFLSNTALPCQVHLPIQFRAASDLFLGQ